ncbi:MAG TPA: hypothetical protein VK511_09945, partial [Gemmatimonadaceae bacterium]|nr:hypothetical protein [Gemmatimonadaceae bacterium]
MDAGGVQAGDGGVVARSSAVSPLQKQLRFLHKNEPDGPDGNARGEMSFPFNPFSLFVSVYKSSYDSS